MVPYYATISHRSNDLSITVTDNSDTTTSITLTILVTPAPIPSDEIAWADELTYIGSHADGTIQEGTLRSNLTLNIEGHVVTLKGETEIYFHDDGSVRIGFLASDAALTVAPHGELTFIEDTFISFRADGTVEQGILDNDRVFTVTPHGEITFQGRQLLHLFSCRWIGVERILKTVIRRFLWRPMERSPSEDTTTSFFIPMGRSFKAYLMQDINLGGVDYPVDTYLRFYADNGEVADSGGSSYDSRLDGRKAY